MRSKQKSNIAVRLDEGLSSYLREKAINGHRSLTSEIRMRLEKTRSLDLEQAKPACAAGSPKAKG